MRQQIFQDVNGNHSLTLMSDQSSNGTTALDYFVATEPGHYYQQIIMYSGQVSDVFSVAAVNTSGVDQYEANDELLKASVLSGGLDYDTYFGNHDHVSDVDYYRYMSDNGQTIQVYLDDPNGLYSVEILNGSVWQVLQSNELWDLPVPTSGYILNFRVVQAVPGTVNPSTLYGLHIGSKITRVADVDVTGEENLTPVTGLYRPFHNNFTWEASLLDSTDNPISGAEVRFEWGVSGGDFVYDYATTGDDGYARADVIVPDCNGNYEIDSKYAGDMWHTEYNPGIIGFAARDDLTVNTGYGDTQIKLTQICDQNIMFSAHTMSNPENCPQGSTYICPIRVLKDPSCNPSTELCEYNYVFVGDEWKHQGHSQEIPEFGGIGE